MSRTQRKNRRSAKTEKKDTAKAAEKTENHTGKETEVKKEKATEVVPETEEKAAEPAQSSVFDWFTGEPDLTGLKEVKMKIRESSDPGKSGAGSPEMVLTDNDTESWEIEEIDPDGGTFIEFELDHEAAVRAVVIKAGDWTDEVSFEKYGVAGAFNVFLSSRAKCGGTMSHRNMLPGVFTFEPGYRTDTVRIVVLARFKGSEFPQTKITSIKVYE